MKNLLVLLILFLSVFGYSQESDSYKFIENKGQWNKNVQFKTDIEGGALYLESNKLTYSFYDEEALESYFHAHNSHAPKKELTRFNLHAYQVEFVGGNTSNIKKEKQTKEYYNYFLGADRNKWASRVYGYSLIQYEELYKDIDFVFYNSQEGALKYDFKVKPNGNTNEIKLKYNGVNSIKLSKGRLVIATSVNKITEEKPYAYQVVNGKLTEIACNYTLKNNEVGFEFPNGYDKSKELIIDPTLIFSTFSGSTTNNFGYTATFDRDGFLYSGSTAFGATYPTTIGAYDRSFNGGIVDIAISKYDTTGTFMVYSTFVGGTSDELPHSMIVNSKDELFVYGTTSSLNFPFSKGCYDSTFNGGTPLNLTSGLGVNFINGSDIFVIRLSGTGDSLMSGTFVGGTGNDGLNSTAANDLRYNYADEVRGEIEIDKNNNIYVVSCTHSTNFPVTPGAFQPTHGGSSLDGCIFKMDNKLTTMIWSSYLGGSGDDAAYSIALDRNDNAYVAGGTNSPNFAKSLNAIDTSYTGIRADGFVTKINTTGSAILNSTYYGTDLYDQIYFVELDRNDSVYVFGQTDKMDSSFIKNAAYFTYNSGQFISKMSPNLDTVEWSTVFGSGGGGPNISPTAFLVDVCNKIYLSGWGGTTNSFGVTNNSISTTGMDTTAGAFQTTTDGSDFYLMVLESDASNIFYGSFYGGPISAEHVDGGTSRFDRNGRIFQSVCAGCGFNSDFPIKPNPGAVSATNGSSCNNGVFKFDFNLPITLADFDANQVSCLNDTTFFTNKSLNGTSFHWNFGDGNFSTQYSPFHVYVTSGNFTVTLTVSDTAACNYSDTLRKQITILSDSLWYLPNDTICDSSFKQIGFLPSSNPVITYSWSPSIGLSDTTISNPIASPFNTITYRLLISNGVCTDTVFNTIVVSKLQLRIPSDTTLCLPGTPITLLGNSLGTTSYFHWSSNPFYSNMLNTSLRDSVLIVSPTVSTTYYLRIGSNGCFKEDTLRVNLFTSQLSITGPDVICLGDTINLSVSNLGTDTLIYDWMPNMEIISGDFTSSISTAPNATTLYSVIATNSVGCRVTLNKSIYVSPLPILSVQASADKNTIFVGQTAQLSATPSGYSYSWTPVAGLNNPTIQNPTANPTTTTTYTVTVSDRGCIRSSDVTITVLDVICGPPDLYVPNAFTPNGDGDNDELFVRGNNITSMTLRVYHRWGEKVFESTNQKKGWDGTYKGKECDPAVFVYYLDVECLGGETYQDKGNITLIR
tara:strand:+ start:645 stop:4394 length:3750 start_codon:yes stop_codon:yes gene_type:complete